VSCAVLRNGDERAGKVQAHYRRTTMKKTKVDLNDGKKPKKAVKLAGPKSLNVQNKTIFMKVSG
jgi:hypothetical protein